MLRALALALGLAGVAFYFWSGRSPAPELLQARRVAAFTNEILAVPSPPGPCTSKQLRAYAREVGAPIADHWYVSSQVMADVALGRADSERGSELRCQVVSSLNYMALLWQGDPAGGYAPRSDLDGSNATTRDIYADDNAIAGIAMLDAADWLDSGVDQDRAVEGAQRAAEFLIASGLWDDEYGGGFWWNTQRHDSDAGKPVQTAGLAAQLFARLYERTQETRYREWALRSIGWSEDRHFDPVAGLYRFGDRPERAQWVAAPSYVSYDQAIMIEAHLAMMRAVDGDARHLDRARVLGSGLEQFRSRLGGYDFELGVPQVFPGYSAWTSSGLLALSGVDPDPRWARAARASLMDLAANAIDPLDNGVYHVVYACVPMWADSCDPGAEQAVGRDKLHLSQSWMQRGFAQLALSR